MLDWGKIETVFLDMDGTLLDLHFDNYFWLEYVPLHYARRHDMSLNDAKRELLRRYDAKYGEIEWYCVDYWTDELNLDILELKNKISGKIALRPMVTELLAEIKQKGKRTVLLTNAHPKTLDLKMSKVLIADKFDRIISSCKIGLPKENLSFWDNLQKAEPFSKDNSLLIDDSKPVLDSARAYGFLHLFAIAKPDLSSSAREVESFITLDNFGQIL